MPRRAAGWHACQTGISTAWHQTRPRHGFTSSAGEAALCLFRLTGTGRECLFGWPAVRPAVLTVGVSYGPRRGCDRQAEGQGCEQFAEANYCHDLAPVALWRLHYGNRTSTEREDNVQELRSCYSILLATPYIE
jgi:hypothetical protein